MLSPEPVSVDVCKVDVPLGRCWAPGDGDLVFTGIVAPSCSPEAFEPWGCCSLVARLLFSGMAPEALSSMTGT